MKKLLVLAVLVAAVASTVRTQSGLSGRWCALVLLPNGGTPELTLDLKADGSVVTASFGGAPVTIREGRLEGDTLTLRAVNDNNRAEVTFTGQVTGNEIVFRATGLFPEAFHFVARRDTRVQLTGRIAEPAVMQQALKQFNVPGVSIAIIRDFKVALAVAVIMTNGHAGGALIQELSRGPV